MVKPAVCVNFNSVQESYHRKLRCDSMILIAMDTSVTTRSNDNSIEAVSALPSLCVVKYVGDPWFHTQKTILYFSYSPSCQTNSRDGSDFRRHDDYVMCCNSVYFTSDIIHYLHSKHIFLPR